MKKHAKNLFIPHEGNDYKPHILQRIAVGVMFFMILLSFSAANMQAMLWLGSDWLVSTILPAVIVEETNDNRQDQSLGTLVRNTMLDAAAQQKADHMAKNEYFAHFAPDGTSPWYFFDQAGYNYVHAGENLAVHFTDSEEVVAAWMNSPGHRANILNGNYREIGIGVARGEFEGFETVYVVQLFGTPAAPPTVAAAIAPTPEPQPVVSEDVTVLAQTEPTSEQVAPASVETVPVVTETPDVIVERDVAVVPEPEPVEPVVSTGPDDTVVIESQLTTTNPEAVEIPVSETSELASGSTPVIARTATQPNQLLQIVYILLGIFVTLALTVSIAIEWRRQHPVQIAYGGGLLATMAALLWIHSWLTAGAVVV